LLDLEEAKLAFGHCRPVVVKEGRRRKEKEKEKERERENKI